jgi:hypothetical protein
MLDQKIIYYEGYKIQRIGYKEYNNGSKGSIGNSDWGKIIKYNVIKENKLTNFEFRIGFKHIIARFNSSESEQELFLKAENKIRECINSGEIQNKKQFNFEFDGDTFSPV